ncbi:13345_t:CDS:1, partial [Ambispora leptoticha]
LNNSADKVPEIRVFNEEGEIITHDPTAPSNNQPVSSTIKEKLLRNLDKICLDPTGELTNAEILKHNEADYYLSKGVYGSYTSE